jgi:hypothetical protein
MQPFQTNILALHNCLRRAGLPITGDYTAALAWACSTWVNRLEFQVEALRLAGIEMDPELYQDALDRARRADASALPN